MAMLDTIARISSGKAIFGFLLTQSQAALSLCSSRRMLRTELRPKIADDPPWLWLADFDVSFSFLFHTVVPELDR